MAAMPELVRSCGKAAAMPGACYPVLGSYAFGVRVMFLDSPPPPQACHLKGKIPTLFVHAAEVVMLGARGMYVVEDSLTSLAPEP